MANILVYGASFTQGYFDPRGGWADRLKQYYLEQEIKHNWDRSINVFNLGISGDTSEQVLKRLRSETKPRVYYEHEIIFIFQVGLNDAIIINGKEKGPINEFEGKIKEIIKYSKKLSEKIIFLGLTPVDESKVTPMPWSTTEYWYNDQIKKYDNLLKKVCKVNKVDYIEIFSKFTDTDNLTFEGAHPNKKGHKKIYKIVKKFLEDNKFIQHV